MSESVPADAVLHQYMAAALNGEPVLKAKASTELDGKAVTHRADPEYVGVVRGPSLIDGFAWVDWHRPEAFTGLHRLTDLQEVTDDRSQHLHGD